MFNNGQRFASITIVILSSNSTEGARSFNVQLANPSGGAGVGVGSVISVVIQPTANSFGTFQFNDTALSSAVDISGGGLVVQARIPVRTPSFYIVLVEFLIVEFNSSPRSPQQRWASL